MTIRKLTKDVYDLIAAGEVVLGPVSVVKELVENALDAGASRIIVEITDGGRERIRVFDNGSGIETQDIPLVFEPHATSKLENAEALSHIETLGFRGEALASVAAVSSVTMVTRADGSRIGARIFTEGGSAPEITPSGSDIGTDITVERLFLNIPARKKHMGDARAEGRKVIEYLSEAASGRPDVAFRLVSDSSLVFVTLGNGDRLSAIASVYGSKTAENLIPVSARTGEMRAEGYISGVLGLRNNKKGQHFYVNGRPVKNQQIEAAIGRAYREHAEPGRFPIVFLLLSVDPASIDVNIHPAKSEISFANPAEVSDFVFDFVREVLNSERSIPKLKKTGKIASDTTFFVENSLENSETEAPAAGQTLVSTSGGEGAKVSEVDINVLLSPANEEAHKINVIYDNQLQSTNMVFAESVDSHYEKSLNIAGLKPVATLFATYILAANGDAFYIIDQHAAHERVNFERFLNAYRLAGIPKQELLTPYMFTPPAAIVNFAGHQDFLDKLGFEADEFGEKTWACRTFPAFVSQIEGEAFLLETLDALEDEKSGISNAAVEKIMKRACKASVKANRILSNVEIEALLADLSKCENPYTCPHGRPVFLKLTQYDIEKMFKRA